MSITDSNLANNNKSYTYYDSEYNIYKYIKYWLIAIIIISFIFMLLSIIDTSNDTDDVQDYLYPYLIHKRHHQSQPLTIFD